MAKDLYNPAELKEDEIVRIANIENLRNVILSQKVDFDVTPAKVNLTMAELAQLTNIEQSIIDMKRKVYND